MLLLRSSILFLLLGLSAIAQTAAEIESEPVKRVAARLACQCGVCKSSAACEMPGGCGFCKRVKTRIAKMQNVGASDKQIIDQIVKEDGPQMYLAEPGAMGWLTPYLVTALGLFVILWFVRRNLKVAPAGDNTVLDRYHERIERDLQKLE